MQIDPATAPPRSTSDDKGSLGNDLGAGVVVFLVALPLCLGIALASGAPLLAGLITGMVGGLVVSWASGSALSVSGPAAGLTVIVLGAIETLGPYPVFTMAVVLSGVIQLALGFAGAGVLGNYFPNTVIKGMLAAIGAILILKQLPHLVGHDPDPEGDFAFVQADGENTLTELLAAMNDFTPGAIIVGVVGIAILVAWPKMKFTKNLKMVPAPLAVVLMGVIFNKLFLAVAPALAIGPDHLVKLPEFGSASEILAKVTFPDFGAVTNVAVWKAAVTIALIASVETLCVDAVDKLDPLRRRTPLSRELKAQGLGNIVAGMIGGIPMTAVIVRGSANVQAGGRTHLSAFFHGVLLFLSVVFLGRWMNEIPLAALAAVLIHIGYKLAPLHLFREMYARGQQQLLPFAITFAAILFIDLLSGVAIGFVVGIFFIIKENLKKAVEIELSERDDADGVHHRILRLDHHVSFLNKAAVRKALDDVQEGERVDIDLSQSQYVDPDVVEMIEDFKLNAAEKDVELRVINLEMHLR